jgi:hypothetical protein
VVWKRFVANWITSTITIFYIGNKNGHERKRRAANIYRSRGLASVSFHARANQRPDQRDARTSPWWQAGSASPVRSCASNWAFLNRSARMCCVAPSLPICSMRAPICAAFSFCSATAIWRPPHATCTSPKPGCTPRRVRSTTGPFASSELLREVIERHDSTSARSGRCLSRSRDQFLQRWGHVISDQQRKALRDIGRCRTAALGTHLERCDRCNYETVAYDSCRNRHCPKCQSSARDRWLMKQASSLLPVPYAHVVFTVPEQLAPLGLRNQRCFTTCCFGSLPRPCWRSPPIHATWARASVLAVLHTWSQNLRHHPHLHCLVPAGGMALDHLRWVAIRRGFFLPVRVLNSMFRGKMLAFLKQSC